MACDQAQTDQAKSQLPQTSNPYLAQQAQGIAQGAQQNYEQNVAPSLRSGAIMAGGYGGSRQGIAEGLAAGEAQKGAINSITNLYGQSYENEQQRNLQSQLAAQQAALQREQMQQQNQQYNTGLDWQKQQFGQQFGLQNDQFKNQQLLQGLQLQQQNDMMPYQQLNTLLGLGGQLQNYNQSLLDAPAKNFLNYANVVQPGAGLGATTSGQQTNPNAGSNWASGALGGAAAGSVFGPWGAAAGGLLGAFSDIRLKENIKRVGSMDNGLPVYTYNYIGDDTTHMGVMAQEVAEVKPEAIRHDPSGYMRVRYDLL